MDTPTRITCVLVFIQSLVARCQGGVECMCSTVQCRDSGEVTCVARTMCFVQYLPLPPAASPTVARVVRGCIDSSSPLLCENRRPQGYEGSWPVLYCCRQPWCNRDVLPTLPTWALQLQDEYDASPSDSRPTLADRRGPRGQGVRAGNGVHDPSVPNEEDMEYAGVLGSGVLHSADGVLDRDALEGSLSADHAATHATWRGAGALGAETTRGRVAAPRGPGGTGIPGGGRTPWEVRARVHALYIGVPLAGGGVLLIIVLFAVYILRRQAAQHQQHQQQQQQQLGGSYRMPTAAAAAARPHSLPPPGARRGQPPGGRLGWGAAAGGDPGAAPSKPRDHSGIGATLLGKSCVRGTDCDSTSSGSETGLLMKI